MKLFAIFIKCVLRTLNTQQEMLELLNSHISILFLIKLIIYLKLMLIHLIDRYTID